MPDLVTDNGRYVIGAGATSLVLQSMESRGELVDQLI